MTRSDHPTKNFPILEIFKRFVKKLAITLLSPKKSSKIVEFLRKVQKHHQNYFERVSVS